MSSVHCYYYIYSPFSIQQTENYLQTVLLKGCYLYLWRAPYVPNQQPAHLLITHRRKLGTGTTGDSETRDGNSRRLNKNLGTPEKPHGPQKELQGTWEEHMGTQENRRKLGNRKTWDRTQIKDRTQRNTVGHNRCRTTMQSGESRAIVVLESLPNRLHPTTTLNQIPSIAPDPPARTTPRAYRTCDSESTGCRSVVILSGIVVYPNADSYSEEGCLVLLKVHGEEIETRNYKILVEDRRETTDCVQQFDKGTTKRTILFTIKARMGGTNKSLEPREEEKSKVTENTRF